MTNFRGRRDSTGKSVKQMTKQAAAPRLQAPKIIKRSHLLTYREEELEVSHRSSKSPLLVLGCTPNFGVALPPPPRTRGVAFMHHMQNLGPRHAQCNAQVPSAASRWGIRKVAPCRKMGVMLIMMTTKEAADEDRVENTHRQANLPPPPADWALATELRDPQSWGA